MKFSQITEDFWMASGRVNIFLFKTGDRLVLIDTGFPREAEKLLAAASTIGTITDIILSHVHIDHTGNAARIAAKTGARVWMHPADADLLAQGVPAAKGTKPARPFTYLFGPIMLLVYGSKIDPIADTTPLIDDVVISELGNIHVHHLPGHTDGQIALEIPSASGKTILFAADVIGNYPRIGLPYVALNKNQMHDSIRKLRDISKHADIMVFGHGKPLANPFSTLDEFANDLA